MHSCWGLTKFFVMSPNMQAGHTAVRYGHQSRYTDTDINQDIHKEST